MSMTKEQWLNMPVHVDKAGKKISTATTGSLITVERRKAYENDVLSVWGDGSAVRDFIYAEDVARGMLHMVENQITEPVNLGSGTGITIKELAETVGDTLGKEIVWDKDKPIGDKIRIFDTKRAESHGFKPKVSLKDGIKNTIEWFLDNIDLIDEKYHAFR